jgi:hypothetical protein
MNAYVTLDGYKYSAPHGNWSPQTERPVVIKRLLSGNTNVTFGPAPMVRWVGMLNADVSPATGFGSITNLRATCAKLTQLSFTDHYGDTFNVILDRSVGEDSLTPQWDGASNKFRVTLTVIKL